jgi:uncharacterized membrane protein
VTRRAKRERRDEGSVLILTIGFALLAMVFVGVVVDASKLFLTRRALASVADGAAQAGAQDVDLAAVYRSGPGAALPLSPARAAAAVQADLTQAARSTGMTDLHLVNVTVRGPDVQVTVSARAVLPFTALVTGSSNGVVITVTASARSAVAP